MKPDITLLIEALNKIIDETEDFNCCLDRIQFIEHENRLLISTQIVEGDTKASRSNKYVLRDNFFKGYLKVAVKNLEGEYAFSISVDELSELQIVKDTINTLQNPPVKKASQKSSFEFRIPQRLDVMTLLEHLKPSQNVISQFSGDIHFIHLNTPHDLIPKGRHFISQGFDKEITDNTNDFLIELNRHNGLDHILFINFTGHEAPVASALYMHGIDCIWQISVLNDKTTQTRIMEQLQDAIPREELILNSTASHDSSLGLILEPNHGFTEIVAKKLPSLEQLKAYGIQRVLLLTEKNYNQGKCIYPLEENYFKCEAQFYHWLQSLSKDCNLVVAGIANFEQKPEENCQTIESVFKKEALSTLPTYKLPNLYTLFKNPQMFATYSAPLSFNGINKDENKNDGRDQSSLSLD